MPKFDFKTQDDVENLAQNKCSDAFVVTLHFHGLIEATFAAREAYVLAHAEYNYHAENAMAAINNRTWFGLIRETVFGS
jgi:hypothetical protein